MDMKEKHNLFGTFIEAVNKDIELSIKEKQKKIKSNLEKRTIKTNRRVNNKRRQTKNYINDYNRH